MLRSFGNICNRT